MARVQLIALLLVVGLGALGTTGSLRGQDLTEPTKKQQEALQKVQNLLAEALIEPKDLRAKMPLAKFLEAIERQLPKDKRISLRIDKDVFGDKYAEVVALPMFAPALSPKASLQSVFDWSFAKSKIKLDYRLGESEITITTPEGALYTMTYDLRDLVGKPDVLGLTDPAFRNADPAKRAALLVKRALSVIEPPNDESTSANREAIQILNGARVVIRTTGSRHTEFVQLFQSMAKLGDLAVITTAKLYEVEDAFYTKLKNAKYVPLEELERQFIEGKAPKGESLFDQLTKQKPILVGEEVKVDAGQEAALLSRYEVVRCLPSPEQVLKKDKTRQTIMEGASFVALIRVAPDRRFVQMKFTENAEVPEIRKVKAWQAMLQTAQEQLGKGPPPKDVFAEVVYMRESKYTRVLEIPDGGSIVVPVHYRPRLAQEKNRWWVLAITSRIYMEEEERQIKLGAPK